MFLDTVRQAFKPQRLVASLVLVKHTRLALIPRSVQSITARSTSYLSTNAQPSATTIAPRLCLTRHHALTFDADVRAIHTQPQHAVDTATPTREAPELTGKVRRSSVCVVFDVSYATKGFIQSASSNQSVHLSFNLLRLCLLYLLSHLNLFSIDCYRHWRFPRHRSVRGEGAAKWWRVSGPHGSTKDLT